MAYSPLSHDRRARRALLLGTASSLGLGTFGPATWAAPETADNADNERWRRVRASVFGDRPILADAGQIIELDTPARAADAAVVPIAFRAREPQTAARFVRKVHLVIDRNPSPLGATFTFTPDSGQVNLETRVRIEEYTHVRVIAEMNDGKLYMNTRFVKASGGCSAPAGKDLAEAMAGVGRMKLRIDGAVVPGQPALAQLMISHPNVSGLAIDQLTRLAPPPYFVRAVDVSYAGRPVLSADVDFTLSENPNLRFFFNAPQEAALKVRVVDSSERVFERSLAVKAGPNQDA